MTRGRLVVVGAGGIGGGLGARAALAGTDVLFVQRGPHGERMRAEGLVLEEPAGERRVRCPCVTRLDEVELTADDHVLVAVKLPDAEAVYDALEGTPATVIVGQNGMQGGRWARARCERVVETMVWVPAEHLVPGRVALFGVPIAGRVDVDPGGSDVRDGLRRAGFDSDVRDPFAPWMHAKWLTNLGGLAHRVGCPERAVELMDEGRAVLEAAGIPHVLDELLATVGHIGLGTIGGRERVVGGSSVQGQRRRRPSEGPWLNGELLEIAREAGVPTPVHDALISLES